MVSFLLVVPSAAKDLTPAARTVFDRSVRSFATLRMTRISAGAIRLLLIGVDFWKVSDDCQFHDRRLEDWEMAALAARATKAARSVEEEVRLILTAAVEGLPEKPEPSSIPEQG